MSLNQTFLSQAPTIIPVLSDPKDFGVQVILAFLTGCAVIVALFQEQIKNWFNQSILNMSISKSPPDCHQINLTYANNGQYAGKAIYVRIKVNHLRGSIAKNVEIIASKLMKKNKNGRWVNVKTFLPMNLQWSHTHYQTVTIPPKSFRHCDLGSFRQPKLVTNFIIDTIVQPNQVANGRMPNVLTPGDYQLECVLSGENIKPQIKRWFISFSPNWSNTESIMLKKNIKINELT
jgi:hypothetical protein